MCTLELIKNTFMRNTLIFGLFMFFSSAVCAQQIFDTEAELTLISPAQPFIRVGDMITMKMSVLERSSVGGGIAPWLLSSPGLKFINLINENCTTRALGGVGLPFPGGQPVQVSWPTPLPANGRLDCVVTARVISIPPTGIIPFNVRVGPPDINPSNDVSQTINFRLDSNTVPVPGLSLAAGAMLTLLMMLVGLRARTS